MKSAFYPFVLAIIIVAALLISATEALSHAKELALSNHDRHHQNIANFLVKRKSSSKNKKKKKKSSDCNKRACPLTLKPCPKDCPLSCGYLNSPDPCCPLLGKPTCPNY